MTEGHYFRVSASNGADAYYKVVFSGEDDAIVLLTTFTMRTADNQAVCNTRFLDASTIPDAGKKYWSEAEKLSKQVWDALLTAHAGDEKERAFVALEGYVGKGNGVIETITEEALPKQYGVYLGSL